MLDAKLLTEKLEQIRDLKLCILFDFHIQRHHLKDLFHYYTI